MSFYLFYFLAIIPIILGGIFYYKNREIVWQEWVIGSVFALGLAIIFHCIAYFGQTSDTETWSGQIIKAVHYPTWIEEYTETHTRTTTDANGNTSTEVCTTVEHRTHHEYWAANSNIETQHSISKQKFEEMRANFQNFVVEKPYKSGFDGGDPNIYVSYNKSGYNYPITDQRSWTNKIKACPSVFSYQKVSDQIPVYEYPENNDTWQSSRLIGTAQNIDILEFDRMNARLGPTKLVNVILVGFVNKDSSFGQLQEAKWIGGRKNDLVICFSGNVDRPDWVYVFSWTDNKICLRNLETIILDNGVNNNVLPLIESEIRQNYRLKDWSEFDYLSVEPPTWSVITYIIIMIAIQTILWMFFHKNDCGKYSYNYMPNYYNRVRWR